MNIWIVIHSGDFDPYCTTHFSVTEAIKEAINGMLKNDIIEEDTANWLNRQVDSGQETSAINWMNENCTHWYTFTICGNEIEVTKPHVVQINDSEGESLGLVCSDDVRNDSLEDIVSKSWEKYIDDDNEYDIYSFIEWHNADPDNTGCQLERFYISAEI